MMSSCCSCHISAPCNFCIDLTEDEIDAIEYPAGQPIARRESPPVQAPAATPSPTYTIDESRDEGRNGIDGRHYVRTMMRCGDIVVWSTWWGIDDGSSSAEAQDFLRRAVEKARKTVPTPPAQAGTENE